MKLLRFITQEEYEQVLAISHKPELITDSKRAYFHAEQMEKTEDIIFMNKILKEVLEGFVSFTCFNAANTNRIRLQYDWCAGDDYKGNLGSFTGVGWILIEELRDGFPSEEALDEEE